MPGNFKLFETGVEQLQEQFKKVKLNTDQQMEELKEDQTILFGDMTYQDDKQTSVFTRSSCLLLPNEWSCAIHDKMLLKALSDKGFEGLNNITDSPDYAEI